MYKLIRSVTILLCINLYDLSQYYYAFFKARKTKCCTKIFLEAFKKIHGYTGYDFKNIDRINHRLCNTFFKAFVKKSSEIIKSTDMRETKKGVCRPSRSAHSNFTKHLFNAIVGF